MDVFPKFIIETDDQEGDCLIVAKCTYHKQLATDITKVKGGGWWTLDRDNSIFTLSGDSHDLEGQRLKILQVVFNVKKYFQVHHYIEILQTILNFNIVMNLAKLSIWKRMVAMTANGRVLPKKRTFTTKLDTKN
jgi:hypothetical protein